MYVYVWKDPSGVPFYVGMAKNICRPSPTRVGHRNATCIEAVRRIGADNIIVEIHTAPDIESAKELERKLIVLFGKLCDGTGTLTNIAKGGEFHETTSLTKEKLKALWQTEEHRIKIKTGKKTRRNLAESTKQILRENLINNPKMFGWDKRNGDPEFDAKRIAGIRAAQPKRLEKMRDPEALAQRKARLKATMSSPEYKAKRALYDTPEYRKKLSDAKKAYWERRRLEKRAQLTQRGLFFSDFNWLGQSSP